MIMVYYIVLHSCEFKGCLFTEQSCDDVDGPIKPKTINNSYSYQLNFMP
jgi:hypothetical protein